MIENLKDFYKNKKIFITGHNGFKGTWLTVLLSLLGAKVCGYSLKSDEEHPMFDIIGGKDLCLDNNGDIRDYENLYKVFSDFKPEIVFHLAAQPIVLKGYDSPAYTYETNVMGTVNILECARKCGGVQSILNVTTDKVYKNNDSGNAFRENDALGGFDPYSNSKSCSELVTETYKNCFLTDMGTAVSTARAGNVIGGGDFAENRIIPDCVKAALTGNDVVVRNEFSIRPYQHVLEPLYAYLKIASLAYKDIKFADNYNVGPDKTDCVNTGTLALLFCKAWGEGLKWINKTVQGAPKEAGFLILDNSKIKNELGIKPVTGIEEAVKLTADWFKAYRNKTDMKTVTALQAEEFLKREGEIL